MLNPVGDDWKIFIHLESPDAKKSHLNADHTPIAGKYPLSLWKKGEIIRDIHRVSIPTSWPSDTVELYVGAWKGPLRLKVTSGPHDDENRVIVTKLKVVGALKEAPKKRIVATKVKNGSIKADGKLDEAAWKTAPSTGPFVRKMDGGVTEQETTAKVLWDDKNLYIAFEMADKDVWSTLTKHDDKLYSQETVEVFIDADGDGKTYVELEANPKGATFDSYLPTFRKNTNEWESGMVAGVKVDGTLDLRNDADKGWVAELAIPLVAARGQEKEMKNVPPVVGTEWRVNLYRIDQPQNRTPIGSAWSPPMVDDFHALDRFGTLVFGDDKGNAPGAKPATAAASPVVMPEPTTYIPTTDAAARAAAIKKLLLTPAPGLRNAEQQ